ncbi:MAG: Stk1 family PASTA domain-containing Ser/Thr kinase [Clostridia bacterium]|nr:Stk1 family PASTA domain-containing Ser/Thr kinase [Clostridia bacterium]
MAGPEGMVFANKYKINKLIGKGGMAYVYLATDITNGMSVAIKILKPELAGDDEFVKRFDSEAKAVASLSHSNIVKVFGVGHEGLYRYIVQEYVDGITVKDLINQNGHLDWRVAVPIVIQVGLALDTAHKCGVIHRDIKPQNILINRDKVAKITDFGIARANTTNTITMTSGGAMGSVHYISPEQSRGGNVGPQSDIYSLGVMLFEMVTGRLPYDGNNDLAIAVKHLQDPIPLASSFVPDIPKGLDSIIVKCMQKLPNLRYQSMRQLVGELDSLMSDPNGVYGSINNNASEAEDVKLTFRQEANYNKVKDFENTVESRRKSHLRDSGILIALVVLIVGILIGVVSLAVTSIHNATQIEKSNEFLVENYVGLTKSEVEKKFEVSSLQEGRDYKIEYEVRDDYVPNIVIRQSISEGITISIGSNKSPLIITISQSEDSDSITVPNYVGLDYRTVLDGTNSGDVNLNFVLDFEETDEMEPNLILRTDPPAGDSVAPGSTVTLICARELSKVEVPDLSELSLSEARDILEESSLSLGNVEGSVEVTALPESQQYVIMTMPEAGEVVRPRTPVNIYVGTWEDVERGGTPTPTPPEIEMVVEIVGKGHIEGIEPVAPGTVITVVAVPDPGYQFSYWQDDKGNIVAYNANFTLTLTETNFHFMAVFTALPTPSPSPTPPPTPTPTPISTPSNPPPPNNDPTNESGQGQQGQEQGNGQGQDQGNGQGQDQGNGQGQDQGNGQGQDQGNSQGQDQGDNGQGQDQGNGFPPPDGNQGGDWNGWGY